MVQIQKQTRGATSSLATQNPILADGQLVLEKSVDGKYRKVKAGNGTGSFNDLPYLWIEEAPLDGKQYARKDAGWEEVASVDNALDTFTGTFTTAGNTVAITNPTIHESSFIQIGTTTGTGLLSAVLSEGSMVVYSTDTEAVGTEFRYLILNNGGTFTNVIKGDGGFATWGNTTTVFDSNITLSSYISVGTNTAVGMLEGVVTTAGSMTVNSSANETTGATFTYMIIN
jgi:hypothetical protein